MSSSVAKSAAGTRTGRDTSTRKNIIVATLAVLAIATSAVFIWRNGFGSSDINEPLQQAVGQMMAAQTANLLGHGKIALVSIDPGPFPELKIQMKAFEKALKADKRITIEERFTLDTGDNPKYRPGAGLSAKHFVKIARKSENAHLDGIVSFVGAPEVTDEDLAALKLVPKVIAEARSPEKLEGLFQKKILMAAIVPRFDFPAPGPKKPKSGQEWFDHLYQVVTPTNALPTPDPTLP